MSGNEVFLEWLKNTLALRPPKNYYIDSERGVEVVRLCLDFNRNDFNWHRSDESTFWLDVMLFVKYKLTDDEILFILRQQPGCENYVKHAEERNAYAELKRGLEKLRKLNTEASK